MAKDYEEIVRAAKKQSHTAKESSARHSRDLTKMQKVASDAAKNAKAGKDRQRKREGFRQAAARIVRDPTE